jgi:hypothetical protein
MKKFELFTLLLFFISFEITYAQWIQVGVDIDGEAAGDRSGVDTSINADGTILAIGAIFNNGINGDNSGQARVFKNQGGSWVQLGNDIDGAAEGDQLSSVCLSADGSIVATGLSKNDTNGTNSGQVRIFKYQGESWVQLGAELNGKNEWDSFGWSLSLSDDGLTIAINGLNNDTGPNYAGYVKIFNYQEGNWVQIGNEIIGEAEEDYSGYTLGNSISLSADGSVVAIGSSKNDGNGNESGHVRVFKNISNNWIQIGNDIDGEAEGDKSGYSVSLNTDGSIIAIGAPQNDGNGDKSGHVRVFKNLSNNWVQIGDDIDGEAIEDLSGVSISINNNGQVLAIGAIGNNGNGVDSGQTRVFINQYDHWVQIGNDIDGEAADDLSGFCVSLDESGSTVAIGAYRNDGNGDESGHVRVYNTNFLSNSEFSFDEISFYPNPTKGILNLDLDIDIATISIYDSTGKIVFIKNNPQQKETLDISNIAKGIYFIKINTNNKVSISTLIKN